MPPRNDVVSIHMSMAAGVWAGRLTVAGRQRAHHQADHLHAVMGAMITSLAIIDCGSDRPAAGTAESHRIANRAQTWVAAMESTVSALTSRVRGMR
jgi:hypothetical protein